LQAVSAGIAGAVPYRLEGLRWRLRTSRLGRSADGIVVLPLFGAALILGVLAATAATRESAVSAPSERARYSVSTDVVTGGDAVTQTITRRGKTLRVVRYQRKPGDVVFETISGDTVTLPGRAVTLSGVATPETHTRTVTNRVTTKEIGTVTETETVATTETQVTTETVTVEVPTEPDN
jgi:hypothetical protein